MEKVFPILTVAIKREHDLLLARKRGRQIAQTLGFSNGDTTRITTAISEMARNAFEYAGGGTTTFSVESHGRDHQELVIRMADTGPGIADVNAVLSPEFQSSTGMGVGIRGTRVLMDRFAIESIVGSGTTIVMAKQLPWSAPGFGSNDVARLVENLAKSADASPLDEMHAQNQELLHTLEELTNRNVEVERLVLVAASARERAEAAQQVAERSLVVRERFMALTTHELRTPLNAIIGYLELLDMELAGNITEKQADYFKRIARASKHLLSVTNDFLEMAKGDAGKLQVARHTGAARQVIAEAAALIAPQAAARDLTIKLEDGADLVTYLGDSNRVRQVLVNLLGNAVSFTPKGGHVEIAAELVEFPPAGVELGAGPWCVIRVADSGPGIPASKLLHVFEPFVQLSANGQSTRKGSGLGLTVSRQLALLMGGDLTVESGESGAVFTLWLSTAPARSPEEARPATREPAEMRTA
jgi:signal transduction histidine kinase